MDIFQLQKDFVSTLIHDTIETYPAQWRLVHEAAQNAADAIYRNDRIKRGLIEINLYVGTNKVSIRDNGTGIDISKFPSIFQLGGGDKRDSTLRKFLKGSQGIGIKATCYTSNFFRLDTIHKKTHWTYTATKFCQFDGPKFDSIVNPPKTKPTSEADGTLVEYSLADYSVGEFLSEIVSEYLADSQQDTVENEAALKVVVETFFRTHTYLGCVLRLFDTPELKPIDVQVNIHFDFPSINDHKKLAISGLEFVSDVKYHGKVIKHSFPGKYLDVLAIHTGLDKSTKVDIVYNHFEEVLGKPPDPSLRKLLIQKFDRQGLERLLYRPKRDEATNAVKLEKNDAKLKHHRRALDYVNGMYLIISQRNYMGKYFHIGPKQLLSVNGLPTNISLSTPRGALAYLNNVHIVLDVDCTLGFGKRNIPGRTKGIIDALFADLWAMLRRVCPLVVGIKEGKDPTDFASWDKELEYDNYKAAENTFRDLPIFLQIVPKEEQEVVALFYELVGRKLLSGYFPFRSGGNRALYDALYYISDSNADRVPKTLKPRDLKVVEFKYHLSEIITEFENTEKFLSGIDLVICWDNDCDEDRPTDYNVHSLEREGIDPLPGAQFRIQRGTDSCQVLALKDFMENLQFSAA